MGLLAGEEVSLFRGVFLLDMRVVILPVDKLWIVKIGYHIYCGECTFGHKIENRPVDMWIIIGDNLCIRAG
ncbi:hypothetical protein A7K84_28910 [Salmonella enterica]|nr:hypothetical protein [Listeria monocytogenes]ECL1903841.1 hypothetical protein [Listeria monocytogenes]MIV05385.1 hypothetical protein [Salmonella enterica]